VNIYPQNNKGAGRASGLPKKHLPIRKSEVMKVRAGRVLGRCHAALGQHMLSVSAFDAAIDLARSRQLLLSEALSVRGRAAAGKNGAGDSGLHWGEETRRIGSARRKRGSAALANARG
jgi:hypothetical protein